MPEPAPAGLIGRSLAWLGGGAFVLSLAVFAWCYAVRFSRPASIRSGWETPVAVNVALFTAFALHHSVMARTGAKRWLARLVPPSLERTAYVWVGSLLFAVTCLAWQDVPGLVYRAPPAVAFALAAIQFAGVWLILRSAAMLDVLELAGIRQAMGWPVSPAFTTAGPYRLVRHPIYLGWVCLTFGSPTMTATKLTFAAISTLYLFVAVPFEERGLVEALGETYRKYQRSVRSRIIPGLY